MPRNVLVVGMARSGTSLTASIFAKKGYFVAEDPKEQLQPANPSNPEGFWEVDELLEANIEILQAVGFPHHNTWTFGEIRPEQAEAVFSLEHLEDHKRLIRRWRDKQPWILKDPRFCYTLAYWWPLLDAANTSALLVTRDPDQIRRSLLRAKWGEVPAREKHSFMRRIEDHIEFARKTIRRFDIPYIEIDYNDYAKRPKETAEKIGSHFGIDLTPDDLGYRSKYDTSALPGYVRYLAEKTAGVIPARLLKRATPDSVARLIYPKNWKR